MISYARGLVLRHGDRLMVFKNRIDENKVQFEYTDNGQYLTETIGQNYRAIRSGKYQLARATAQKSQAISKEEHVTLPSNLSEKQEEEIAYKLKYVRAAIRSRIPAAALARISQLIDRIHEGLQTEIDVSLPMRDHPKPSAPTVRNWITAYKKSGSNAFMLIDKRGIRKRSKRIDSRIEDIVDEVLRKRYLKIKGDSINGAYDYLIREIRARNFNEGCELETPSINTLKRRVGELPKMLVDKHRYGTAYAKNKWRYSIHGDQSTRVMERVEIDHTLLDVWVIDPRSGIPLGRPWVTVLIDRYSKYIVGIHVSFYGPSTSSVASALKMSIEPKDVICEAVGGLSYFWSAYGVSEMYVMDNGKEMHSDRFRRIGWELQSDFIYNPVRHPWLKSSIERTMREICRILPAAGKVYAPVKNAQVPDPKKTASIMFDDLCEGLIKWVVDVYPRHINRDTLTRPIDLWTEGVESMPPITLPETTQYLDISMGISYERTIGRDGLLMQYLRYNSPELQDYCRTHKQSFRTEIRIVPDDISSCHIYLERAKSWIKVPLVRPYGDYGNGLSLLQHQIIRKQAGNKLKVSNAEEELYRARMELKDRWDAATSRGKALKKQADLIRLQNLTSARLTDNRDDTPIEVPEASEMLRLNFEQITPFKTFKLDDGEAYEFI
jgi:putative transposase